MSIKKWEKRYAQPLEVLEMHVSRWSGYIISITVLHITLGTHLDIFSCFNFSLDFLQLAFNVFEYTKYTTVVFD